MFDSHRSPERPPELATLNAILRWRRATKEEYPLHYLQQDLVDVLFYFDSHKCTDSRDVIFGLQGVVRASDRTEVDYSITREDLCLNVAEFLIQKALEAGPLTVIRLRAGAVLTDLPKTLGVDRVEKDFSERLEMIKEKLFPWEIGKPPPELQGVDAPPLSKIMTKIRNRKELQNCGG